MSIQERVTGEKTTSLSKFYDRRTGTGVIVIDGSSISRGEDGSIKLAELRGLFGIHALGNEIKGSEKGQLDSQNETAKYISDVKGYVVTESPHETTLAALAELVNGDTVKAHGVSFKHMQIGDGETVVFESKYYASRFAGLKDDFSMNVEIVVFAGDESASETFQPAASEEIVQPRSEFLNEVMVSESTRPLTKALLSFIINETDLLVTTLEQGNAVPLFSEGFDMDTYYQAREKRMDVYPKMSSWKLLQLLDLARLMYREDNVSDTEIQ